MLVGVANFVLTRWIPQCVRRRRIDAQRCPACHAARAGGVKTVVAIWAVEGALLLGIVTVVLFAWRPRDRERFAEGSKAAVAGALLASMNTASEYGFGAVIAALPGFSSSAMRCRAIPNPLVNEAVTVTALAGITGSASGGMSIALAAMADSSSRAPRPRIFRWRCCTAWPRWRAAAWTRCRTTAR